MFIVLASYRTVAPLDLWLLQPVDVASFVGLFPAADLFLEGTKICTERGNVYWLCVVAFSGTAEAGV